MTRAELEREIPEEWRQGTHVRAWSGFIDWAERNRPALGNVPALWMGFRAGWILKGTPLKRRKSSGRRS